MHDRIRAHLNTAAIFALALLFALVLPVGVFEGDEFVFDNHIKMALQSQFALSEGYRFWTGPMLFWINYLLSSIIPIPPLAIYTSISFISYITGLFLAYRWQRALFKIHPAHFVLGVFLCQELLVTALYPNDFAMLLPWLMAAIHFRLSDSKWSLPLSAACFTVALLIRMDTLLALPLLLIVNDRGFAKLEKNFSFAALVSFLQKQWKASQFRVALYCALPAVAILLMAGMSPTQPFQLFNRHLMYVRSFGIQNDSGFVDSWMTIFDLTMIAFLPILILAQRNKPRIKMMILAAAVWIPYLALYAWNLHTPKYFVIALVVSIPIFSQGVSYLASHLRVPALWPILILMAFALFWPAPYRALGIRNNLMTHDGPRRFVGSALAYSYVKTRKEERKRHFSRQEAKILKAIRESQLKNKNSACVAYTKYWIMRAELHGLLLKLNYIPAQEASYWIRGDQANPQGLPLRIRVVEFEEGQWQDVFISGTNCQRIVGDW